MSGGPLTHGGFVQCRATGGGDERVVALSGYDIDGDFMLYLAPAEVERLIADLTDALKAVQS